MMSSEKNEFSRWGIPNDSGPKISVRMEVAERGRILFQDGTLNTADQLTPSEISSLTGRTTFCLSTFAVEYGLRFLKLPDSIPSVWVLLNTHVHMKMCMFRRTFMFMYICPSMNADIGYK